MCCCSVKEVQGELTDLGLLCWLDLRDSDLLLIASACLILSIVTFCAPLVEIAALGKGLKATTS